MKDIQDIQVTDILSVYSGRADECCCGCAGKYYYNPASREEASTARGYPVEDKELNPTMVAKVLQYIKAEESLDNDPEMVSAVIGKRLYIAYLRAGARQ